MSRAGFSRTDEPDLVPREEGTLFKEIVDFHLSDLGYNDQQLRQLLHLEPDELKELSGDVHQGLRLVR
jgi:hypothetical protein